MTDVSVIIVNYKTAPLTVDCINSLFEKTDGISFEVIVVDNASGDDSVEKLKTELGDRIVVIPSEYNLGFGKGNNLGAEHASGRYLFLLNPDTYLLNNAIKILADYLDQYTDIGIVGGNLYFPDQSPSPSFCMAYDYPDDEKKNASWLRILSRKIRDKINNKNDTNKMSGFNYTDDPLDVAYIFGADMMIRRDLFEKVDGFDPEFFMYAEEVELSWRISQRGYRIVNVPDAKIVHLEGASTSVSKGFSSKQFSMRMNGKLIYYRKCFGEEGVETFYKARRLLYKRLLKIAKIRGKDITQTNAYKMLECLDNEYTKYKNKHGN